MNSTTRKKRIRDKFEGGVKLKFNMLVRPAKEKMLAQQDEFHFNFKISEEQVIWG